MTKQRSFLYDTLRGLLIWSIPISHFTRVGGHFASASLSGVVYITINVFVMQAFVFLSGFFSKKPDRARQSAFKTFMLPYLVFTPIFYLFRYAYFGKAHLNFLLPPFALWFLFSVFFYRFFLKDLVKIPHILTISFAVYIFAGQIPYFSDFLALGRTVSYFPFFMLGYYCTTEQVEKIQRMKKWQCALLGTALTAVSCWLAFGVKAPVGFYLLKGPASELGMAWYTDILLRVLIIFLACGWMAFLFAVLPKTDNYLTYVGRTTMPVYIFHLFVRYVVKVHGLPDLNQPVYYACLFGFASLCVIVFSSPPVARVYDGFMELCYRPCEAAKNAVVKLLGKEDRPPQE